MTFVSTKLDHRNFLIHCNYQIKCSILQIFSLALLVCVSYDNTALLSACINKVEEAHAGSNSVVIVMCY